MGSGPTTDRHIGMPPHPARCKDLSEAPSTVPTEHRNCSLPTLCIVLLRRARRRKAPLGATRQDSVVAPSGVAEATGHHRPVTCRVRCPKHRKYLSPETPPTRRRTDTTPYRLQQAFLLRTMVEVAEVGAGEVKEAADRAAAVAHPVAVVVEVVRAPKLTRRRAAPRKMSFGGRR